MKRTHTLTLTFVFSLMLLGISSVSYSRSDEQTEVINVRKNIPTTRSIVEVPEASISHEVLTVCFSSAGIYSLTVSDSLGSPVYISSLPANGMEYSYDLSGIGEGTFTLTLEGPSGEYEGVFNIY